MNWWSMRRDPHCKRKAPNQTGAQLTTMRCEPKLNIRSRRNPHIETASSWPLND
jgi:hypothetical protein